MVASTVQARATKPSSPVADSASTPVDSHQLVRDLELSFREDPTADSPHLTQLIELITPKNPVATKAILAVRRALLSLPKLDSQSPALLDFSNALLSLLKPNVSSSLHDAAIASAALTHQHSFTQILSLSLSDPHFPAHQLVHASVSRFPDLQHLALCQLRLASTSPIAARLALLRACDAPATSEPACTSVTSRTTRAALTAAWLSVLHDNTLPREDLIERLQQLPHCLLPRVSDALALADVLTASYDACDLAVALAALDGLFVLISKHGLDYPRFYHKLYALLTQEALLSPARHRFLELTAAFLRRDILLPGRLVAAFVKRLTRRALTLPSGTALWCLRLALDLLFAHPAVSFLVHRTDGLFADGGVGEKRKRVEGTADPFDDKQDDPEKSNADESSLWELEILEQHVSPAVSRLVATFKTDVRKRPRPVPGSLSDYAELTFKDVFEAEVKRKAKSSHVAYEAPGTAPQLVELQKKLKPFVSWT